MAKTLLFFDTETTGLLDFKADLAATNQPRVIALAAVLVKSGDLSDILSSMDVLIKPDGWTVPQDVEELTGITQEKCEADGIGILQALSAFNAMKARCDVRVGHNISFDKRMLLREEMLAGIKHDSDGADTYCTAQHARSICNIPAIGRKGNKLPTLVEAYRHFYGKPPAESHSAMADVMTTIAVYRAINNG